MRKDVSPEERLLRLIKGAKKKEFPKKEEAPPQEAAGAVVSRPSAEAAKTKSISISLPFKELNTRVLNTALIVILIALLAYFLYDLFYSSSRKKDMDIFMQSERAPGADEDAAIEVKPYSFYSSAVDGRNIFMPQQVEVEEVVTGPTVEEISSTLSLIGIIAGERPQAIIEDKKTGKSHFLYNGGFVGKAKIVDILPDSVIMEYQGQTFELVL